MASWRCFPRVDDVQPSSFKRTGFAGGDGEAVGDGCNEGIGRFDRQADSAGLGQQLGYRDRGQVQRFQRLRVDPFKDAGIGFPALRLRNHVGIEQDHSKLTARVASRRLQRAGPRPPYFATNVLAGADPTHHNVIRMHNQLTGADHATGPEQLRHERQTLGRLTHAFSAALTCSMRS